MKESLSHIKGIIYYVAQWFIDRPSVRLLHLYRGG